MGNERQRKENETEYGMRDKERRMKLNGEWRDKERRMKLNME